MNVAFITDSFPPIIDGVSRCVLECAKAFTEGDHGNCIIITPYKPGGNELDLDYPFPVFRFPSVGLPKMEYRAGYPFFPAVSRKFKQHKIDLIHVHSPFLAMSLARQLRRVHKIPIVYTQHTKWEYDIERAVAIPAVRKSLKKLVYSNINAADDVWVVSNKTGEHIAHHGYKGSYTVMENGTDFIKADANENFLRDIIRDYGLSESTPLFLFVGRMMWYKNQMMIFDALEILKSKGFDFKMVFIGDGRDLSEMKKTVREKNLHGQVFFVGRIDDRELLRAYYIRSDMFVFPSTYDNAPLVIREAAACGCPSLVVRGSSASEILEENREAQTAFFSDENPASLAASILDAFGDRAHYDFVKNNAAEKVYRPWSRVVGSSAERYAEVLEAYNAKLEKKKKHGRKFLRRKKK